MVIDDGFLPPPALKLILTPFFLIARAGRLILRYVFIFGIWCTLVFAGEYGLIDDTLVTVCYTDEVSAAFVGVGGSV